MSRKNKRANGDSASARAALERMSAHARVRPEGRDGNTLASFAGLAQCIADSIKHQPVLLDGEIVCLDEHGRSQFNDLLFHRDEPYFFAFDLLWQEGEDFRRLPLIERKVH
jgi:ATP-dependent DNA ligase